MKKIGYIALNFFDDLKKDFQKYVEKYIKKDDLFYIKEKNKIKGGIVIDKLHLTLLFGIDNDFFQEDHIQKIEKKEIVLGDLYLFYIPEFNCNALVVKVIDDGYLKQLHNSLMKKIKLSKKNKFDFVPHITIAYVKKDFKLTDDKYFFGKKVKIKSVEYKIKS